MDLCFVNRESQGQVKSFRNVLAQHVPHKVYLHYAPLQLIAVVIILEESRRTKIETTIFYYILNTPREEKSINPIYPERCVFCVVSTSLFRCVLASL